MENFKNGKTSSMLIFASAIWENLNNYTYIEKLLLENIVKNQDALYIMVLVKML